MTKSIDRELSVHGLLLPLPGNERLARHVADIIGWESGTIESRRFPDGETFVRVPSNVTGRSVTLVCTLARPDCNFLQLIFAADAVRDLGARDVTLIAPYLAYMRQDQRFQTGEAVTSRSFARLVSSTFDRLITVDPHLHRYPALSALYTIPTETLHAAPVLADWIANAVTNPLLVGPDEESEQWVSSIAGRIGSPHAVLRKVRRGDRDVDIELPDLSEWRGRQPVLVDDIASSGHTLIEAARKLPLQGFPLPVVTVVHAIFAEESYQRLAAVTDRIVSADSVLHESNAIRLAPLIANALAASGAGDDSPIRHRRPPDGVDGSEADRGRLSPSREPDRQSR